MARIDQDGINEINEKIKNPLESIYNKLENRKMFQDFADEFDFIYRFLDTINNDWQKVNENTLANPTPTVTVDGKEYRPIRG
jgi:hypothetical protein